MEFTSRDIDGGYRNIHQGLPISSILTNKPSFIKQNDVFPTALSEAYVFLSEITGRCKVLNKRINNMSELFFSSVSKRLASAAVAFLLAGCVAGSNIDMLSHYKKTISEPAGDIKRLKSNFDINPNGNSQAFGEAILKLMYAKHPVLGQEMSELPDLRDGITSKEALALVRLYNILRPVQLADDFMTHVYEPMMHKIKIEWRANRNCDLSAKISYGINHPRHTIHKVTPVDFEPEDSLNLELLDKQRKLMWYAKAGPDDEQDSLVVELDYPLYKTVMIDFLHQDTLVFFSMSELMKKGKIEFNKTASLNGDLCVTYLGGIKSQDAIDQLSKEYIIRHMLRMGKGKKYSPSLEALLWSILDGNFTDELLTRHTDAIEMTRSIWGQMDGPRWKNYESVVKRLSDKYLVHYYSKKKIDYKYYIGSRLNPYTVFSKGWANCKDGAKWFQVPLRAAKYKTFLLLVESTTVEGHVILAFDDNGEIYVFDHSRTGTKLIGPFESRYKIPYKTIILDKLKFEYE